MQSLRLAFITSTASPSGSEWLPLYSGGRLLFTTWLLASMVFMSCYGGILTAMLTFPRVTIPIDSIYDLVAQTKMPWKIEGGSMLYQYFEVTSRAGPERRCSDIPHSHALL